MTTSSNNSGGRMVRLLSVERDAAGSNLAVHFVVFFPLQFFSKSCTSVLRIGSSERINGRVQCAARPVRWRGQREE
jgi:hypothetical protein